MRILRPLILGLVGLLTFTTSLALTSASALAKSPVVVELFTSQGCSSCLKADDLMGEVADRPGILLLTYAVDYWDYLGWRDTFAKEDYSARQRAYMKRMSGREVYTPQIVVNGTSETAAIHADKVDPLIRRAGRAKGLPSRYFASAPTLASVLVQAAIPRVGPRSGWCAMIPLTSP